MHLSASRSGDLVTFDAQADQWIVSGYDEVRALLADERLSADRMQAFAERAPAEAVGAVRAEAPWLISPHGSDYEWIGPIVHAGLRKTSSAVFKDAVALAASDVVDELVGRERFDLVTDYAAALTGRMLADLLGFDRRDARRLVGWGHEIVAFFKADEFTADGARRMASGTRSLVDHVRARLDQGRPLGADGFIGLVAKAAEDRRRPLDDEALGSVTLPLVTGHVDAAHLVATTIWLILSHEDERGLLAEKPHLLAGAVGEALRFAPPVACVPRTPLERLGVDGHVIEPGAKVQLSIAAAHRDPVRFPNPDRYDIGRSQRGALGFGHGPRACVAAALGRTYAAIALDTLLRRRPTVALDPCGDVRWRDVPGMLALERVDVCMLGAEAPRPV